MNSYICSKSSSPITLALSIIVCCYDDFLFFSTYYLLLLIYLIHYITCLSHYTINSTRATILSPWLISESPALWILYGTLVGKYELSQLIKWRNDFLKFIIYSTHLKKSVIKIYIMNKIILFLNSKMDEEYAPKDIVAIFHMPCYYQEVLNTTNTPWNRYIRDTTWCSLISLQLYRSNLGGAIFVIILCYEQCSQSL